MVAFTFGIITYTLNIKWETATMWQYCQQNPIEMFLLLLLLSLLPFNPSETGGSQCLHYSLQIKKFRRILYTPFKVTAFVLQMHFSSLFIAFAF